MKRYRERNLQLLIATDVAARGIDVNDVTHVINYSLPDEVENYTHRSGRTARAGKTGISLSLVNAKEQGKIRRIEKIIGKSFERREVPKGEEVCAKQLFAIVDKIHNVDINEELIAPFLPAIMEQIQDLSKEDIIKRFASLEFNRFLDYYKNAPDLNAAAGSGGDFDRADRGERRGRSAEHGYPRLFMNLGTVDELSRGDLLGLICDSANISGRSVGKIDMKGVFSFFEVENAEVGKILDGFKNVDFNGRQVRIEMSGSDGGGESRGGGYRSDRGGRGGDRRGGFRSDRRGGGFDRRDRRDGGGFRDFSAKRRESSRSRY